MNVNPEEDISGIPIEASLQLRSFVIYWSTMLQVHQKYIKIELMIDIIER